MCSKYNLARCPSLPGRRKGAQGSPRPSRDCGRARAGLSFLTAGCHLVMEEPRQRGPRLGTQGRALRLGGWSPALERVGRARRGGGYRRHLCRRAASASRSRHTGMCRKICLWRCPGCLCQDHHYLAAPCPGSSTCWSLSKGPSVTAGEWRVKVQLTSASVPPALALLHKYWAVATWRGALALCSVCSFPRAVYFLLIIPQRQTLLGRIEDGTAFPAPPGPGTLDCGMGHTQPDPGCWPSAWDCLEGVQKGST